MNSLKNIPIQTILFLLFSGVLTLFINSNNILSHNLQQMGIESIVERGHFYLDGSTTPGFQPIASSFSDVVLYNGKHITWRQHGQYIVGSFAYFFLHLLDITYKKDVIFTSGLVTLFTSVFMASLIGVLFFNICLFFLNDTTKAFLLSIFMIFGTTVFPYSVVTHYDTYAMFFVFISFYCLFSKYRITQNNSIYPVIVSGLASGLSVFMSFKSISIVLVILLYLLTFRKKLDIVVFLLTFLIGILPTFLFNLFHFGDPLLFPENIGLSFYKDLAIANFFSLDNLFSKVYSYFISPTTSVTVFSPIYLFALIGFFFLPKKYLSEKILLPMTLLLTFIQLLNLKPTGGCQYGPRYLLLTMPFIMIGLVGFFETKSKHNLIKRIIYFLGAISILIQIPGGLINEMCCDTWRHSFFTNLASVFRGEFPKYKFISHGVTFLIVAALLTFTRNNSYYSQYKKYLSTFNEKYGLKWVYISIIMIITFITRLSKLDLIPLGLYGDEASIGYNAFSISKTGMDEHGELFPIYFRAFGEYKNPAIIYFAAILIKLFGPTIFILRLTPTIFGILTVLFTYKLCNLHFDKKVSLLAALLLAISPWHILISRQVFDGNILPFFVVLGLYLLSKGIKNDDKYILYSAIPIGISFYCYAVAKLFIPLLYLFFILLNLKIVYEKRKYFLGWFFSILIILSPMIYVSSVNPGINGRFNMLFIGNAPESEQNQISKTPLAFLTKSKFTLIPALFVQNYFKHMSFDFLLERGDRNLRHNPTGNGQILFFTFWMCWIGFFYLLLKCDLSLYFLPAWLLIFPVSASLTWEGLPHASRCTCGLPVFEILAAVGFYYTVLSIINLKNKINKVFFISLLFIFCTKGILDLDLSLKSFYQGYAQRSSWWYDYEISQISKATEEISKTNIILIPFDFNPINILFLQKVDPYKYINGQVNLNYIKTGADNLILGGKNIVRICRIGEFQEEEVFSYIYDDKGNPIFEIKVPAKHLLNADSNYKPNKVGGLTANYFSGKDFNELKLTRVDPEVNFNYIWGSPDPLLPSDNFSIEWSGWINIPKSGVYKFITENDNGVKLFIDGKSLIDKWVQIFPTTNTSEIFLSSGWHTLVLDYNEESGTGNVKLQWQKPGGVKEIIPSGLLSPDPVFKN